MRQEIREEISRIDPLDDSEKETIEDAINWIDSGDDLFRLVRPDIPNKHLVSYFAVVDGDYLLLVDHINAEMWLPTGGHVEPNELPRDTAIRECLEELNLKAEFLIDEPVFITCTETVGKTCGHTDVSIWYALKGNRQASIKYDENEFNGVRWFHKDSLPENTDPHLERFVQKLYKSIPNSLSK